MKRKLLTIFALFVLLLPISACGEDEEQTPSAQNVVVNTSLGYGSIAEDDKIYRISDCAKISGGGTFVQGSSVTIVVEYINSACSLYGWKIGNNEPVVLNEPSRSGRDIYTISGSETLNVNSIEIQALINSTKASAVAGKLFFSGVKETASAQYTPGNGYAFHVLEDDLGTSGNQSISLVQKVKEDFSEYSSSITISTTMKLSQAILSRGSANLAYIYKKSQDSDTYTLLTNRLKWYKGKYQYSYCDYADKELITDPMNFMVPVGENTCVVAEVTGESIAADDSNSIGAITGAMSHLGENQYYISTNNASACLNATSGNVSVSADCFYVYRLKNIYNAGVDHTDSNVSTENKISTNTVYYGLNSDGKLEGVNTAAGTKNYYLCKGDSSYSPCSTSESYRVTYPYTANNDGINTAYKMLNISSFIDALVDETYTDVTYQYDKNTDLIAIKSMKIGDTTYYFNPIKSANYYNPADSKINSFTSAQQSKLYSIIANPYNVVHTTSQGYDINYSVVNNKFKIDDVEYTLVFDTVNTTTVTSISAADGTLYTVTSNSFTLGDEKTYSLVSNDLSVLLNQFTLSDRILADSASSDAKAVFITKLYQELNKEENADLRELLFDITVTGNNINLSYGNAMITDLSTYSFIVYDNNGSKTVCSTSAPTNCASDILNVIKYLIDGAGEETLKDVRSITSIIKNENTITYVFNTDLFTKHTVVYNIEEKSFTYGNSTLTFTNVEPTTEKLDVATITSTIKTQIGDVVQTYTMSSETVTTTLDGNTHVAKDEDTIKEVAAIVKEATYHNVEGSELLIHNGTPYDIKYNEQDKTYSLTYNNITYVLTLNVETDAQA